jgi:hypothetical protein
MNSISIHIITGMFPFFSLLIGIFFFLFSFLRHNKTLKISSLFLFILAGFCLILLYSTGENAAFSLKDYAGLHFEWREKHEFWGMIAMGTSSILFLFSLILILKTVFIRNENIENTNLEEHKEKKTAHPHSTWNYVILIIAFFTLFTVSLSVYYGMQIRHTEIQAQAKFLY